MALFALPATSAENDPGFADADACSAWLQTVPLINVAPAQGALLGRIEELNSFTLPADQRLKILEVLREPVYFVQAELAKKFSGRALPLGRLERDIFLNVTALWDALGLAYQHCLEAVAAGDLIGQGAISCQRALDCVAQKISEHYKAYQEVEPDDWHLAHTIYRFAEDRHLEQIDVSDPQCKASTLTTPEQTWLRTMLLNLANPNEHSPRQLAMIAKWLERWAERVTVSRESKDTGLTQLAVDLAGSACASREAASGEDVRYLGMDELGASLKKRITLLRKGESPQSLKLGDDCVQPYCEQNLILLYRQLCEASNTRDQSRKSASTKAQVSSGIGGIHHYISGLPFKQPGSSRELSAKERQEIATFGRVATREDSEFSQIHGYAIEVWALLDESLAGLRMSRSADAAGGRFAHSQLVGVRPADSKHFMLGTVRWLLSTHELDLNAGVRLMPGVPQAVAVKPTGINAQAEKYVPALALPEVAALHAPASLILPNGWFRPKRVIEVWRDAPQQLLLTGIIERGADFERVTYQPA
jgi:hypothetical protein